MQHQFFTTSFLLLTCALQCNTFKILLIPFSGGSNLLILTSISKDLIKQGHDVHLLLAANIPDHLTSNTSKIIVHRYGSNSPGDETYEQMTAKAAKALLSEDTGMWEGYKTIRGFIAKEHSRYLTDNDEIIESLRKEKFDLAVVYSLFFAEYLYLIPHCLGVPWVTLADVVPSNVMAVPWLPSFVPHKVLAYSDKMSFFERVINTIVTIAFQLNHLLEPPTDMMVKYRKCGEFSNLHDLISRSRMFLYSTNIAFDYPIPMMPNMVDISGTTMKPASGDALPSNIEEFIKGAQDGVILVTFGSMVSVFPQNIATKFIKTFKQFPRHRIIWRMDNQANIEMPENVMTLKWLPQNDILADPRVKLFITHGGNSGQMEGVYHAVPMICFPLAGDQPYNCKKLETKGFGLQMKIKESTSEELEENMRTLLTDSSYKSKISHASSILKSAPQTQTEKAAYWINHVIRFGGDHLRGSGNDLPFYQYWLLDVWTFIAGVMFLMLFIIWKVVKCCVVRICKGQNKRHGGEKRKQQ